MFGFLPSPLNLTSNTSLMCSTMSPLGLNVWHGQWTLTSRPRLVSEQWNNTDLGYGFSTNISFHSRHFSPHDTGQLVWIKTASASLNTVKVMVICKIWALHKELELPGQLLVWNMGFQIVIMFHNTCKLIFGHSLHAFSYSDSFTYWIVSDFSDSMIRFSNDSSFHIWQCSSKCSVFMQFLSLQHMKPSLCDQNHSSQLNLIFSHLYFANILTNYSDSCKFIYTLFLEDNIQWITLIWLSF